MDIRKYIALTDEEIEGILDKYGYSLKVKMPQRLRALAKAQLDKALDEFVVECPECGGFGLTPSDYFDDVDCPDCQGTGKKRYRLELVNEQGEVVKEVK